MPLSTHPAPLSRSVPDQSALLAIAHAAQRLTGAAGELDGLVAGLGAARYALLGGASHGTHEFHEMRATLTRRLIEAHGVTAIAIEGDWHAAWRVNRYVRGLPGAPDGSGDTRGAAALLGFQRFPAWMWRNAPMLEFVEWLRAYNLGLPLAERVGFHGLDLYSLFASIDVVLRHLDTEDPAAAARARARYACFDHFRDTQQPCAYAAHFDMSPAFEDALVAQLVAMQRADGEGLAATSGLPPQHAGHASGATDPDARFQTEQNARVARNAERYYRGMFGARVASWNLRDQHMAETLDALDHHLQERRGGRPPKFAVWAHNTHLGDARASEMHDHGELNLGQLLRQRHGREVFTLGFSTYTGTVAAATAWGAPAQVERVRPSLPDSCEALMHEALFHTRGAPGLVLPLRGKPELARALREPRLQRAIGIVYAPQTERQSHYFMARLAEQFDALVHIDTTQAVQPLLDSPPADGQSPQAPQDNGAPQTLPGAS